MRPILQLLQTKVLPWTDCNSALRLIVARPEMNKVALPTGVTLSRRKVRGKRVVRKDLRKHNNQRLHVADWPDDNLQEIALPRLVCIVNGQADYRIAEYSLHCEAGTFLLIPPRIPHHRDGPFLDPSRASDASCTLLFARTYSHGVYVWFSCSTGTRHVNNKDDNYLILEATTVQLFRVLLDEAIAAHENFEIVCGDLLHAFFTIVAREIEAGRYTHPGPKEDRESPVPSPAGFAGELQEYIEANFNKPLKLGDVAARMYLSTPQFCRRVRAETGTTFIELLTRYRLERAQELLRETDWTASAIASHVGFQSASYFQNLFRRRVGSTPTKYRYKKR